MKWYEKQKQLFDQKNQELEKNETNKNIENTVTASSNTTLGGAVMEKEKKVSPAAEETEAEKVVEMKIEEPEISVPEIEEPVVEDITPKHALNLNIPTERKVTTINANTSIQGNITTEDNMVIYGTLIGDITCEGDLTVYGKIKGNIICHNASFFEANIEGDVQCSNELEISENSVLHGKVNAVNLYNGGQIKGDAIVEETAHFKNKSAIIGNITSLEIEIDRGAIIQGNISITDQVDF